VAPLPGVLGRQGLLGEGEVYRGWEEGEGDVLVIVWI
jgi:hypothetical protein